MKFDWAEFAPVLLAMARKYIEDHCSCGSQASDTARHTVECRHRMHVEKTARHSHDRAPDLADFVAPDSAEYDAQAAKLESVRRDLEEVKLAQLPPPPPPGKVDADKLPAGGKATK